jgi:serine/threonine protein kinase
VFNKGQVLSGRYRLVSLQGQGGMALVYRAYDLTLERTVAIKVLRPEYDAGDAFRHEARAIARLPHPNIVTVFDVGQHDGANYIVMEFVEGQDLKEWIKTEAPVRTGRALDITIQVCEAVGFAHEQGILHCDLKPQNVLILPDGQVKVADFGIARALSTISVAPQEKAWGTPQYASPELIAGQTLTPASDVYAIGILLYEMLAGRPPFEGQNAVDIARQHVQSAPPPIQQINPRVPGSIEQILDRALAKDPARRYPTVKQLGKLLAAYRRRGETVTQPLEPITVAESPALPKALAEGTSLAPRTSTAGGAPPPASKAPARTAAQPQPKTQVDWALLLLGALALVAVLGLVPLWGAVITRALEQQSPGPTATVSYQPETTPTMGGAFPSTTPGSTVPSATPSAPAYATVPDLVGQPLERARQLAQDARLSLVVGEERHDVQIPVLHIISQAPSAGDQVPQGTGIAVAVSLGPERVTIPDVVGFPLSVKRLDLEDLGLVIAVTDTWSTEPAGLIVRQEPPAGEEISVGSVVTLSVSTGSRSVVEANFDDKILLYSAELNGMTFRAGDTIQVMITWHVLDRVPAPYTTFIHVTDPSGQIAAQLDRPPLGGSRPTDTWRTGEKFLDPYTLPIPENTRPGLYWVRIGLYRADGRLPVIDPGSAQAEQDAVLVHQITVAD